MARHKMQFGSTLALVPNKIADLRKARGLTQATMAEEFSTDETVGILLRGKPVSRSLLSLMEAGRVLPSPMVLAALCTFLKCKPEEMYEDYVLVVVGAKTKGQVLREGTYWQ